MASLRQVVRLLHEDGFLTPELLVVVKGILLILRLWISSDILAAYMSHDVSNIVVLKVSQLAAPSDNDFIATSTKVLFIMDEEILATLRPKVYFRDPAVVGHTDLYR